MSREPTEMELRVAEALWIADAGGRRLEPWSDVDPTWQARWVRSARAAIRAMREPTIEMINDGLMTFTEAECMSDDGVTIGASEGDDPFETAWKAMVDAASPEIGD